MKRKELKKDRRKNCWVKILQDVRTGVTEGIDDYIMMMMMIIQFNSIYLRANLTAQRPITKRA
jgi:hypothetical protein